MYNVRNVRLANYNIVEFDNENEFKRAIREFMVPERRIFKVNATTLMGEKLESVIAFTEECNIVLVLKKKGDESERG